MRAEEGEYQVQRNAGSRGGHLHEEGRARGGSSGSTQPLSSWWSGWLQWRGLCKAYPCQPSQMCPQFTFSVWISELFFSRAKHTSFHFHWQLQTEANFWNTGMHLKFHFHFSEIIQMSSVYTEPSQQSELFSILLWRGSWFWLFTHFGAIKSPAAKVLY